MFVIIKKHIVKLYFENITSPLSNIENYFKIKSQIRPKLLILAHNAKNLFCISNTLEVTEQICRSLNKKFQQK